MKTDLATENTEPQSEVTQQNENIKALWKLLEELGKLGVQIGVSGSLKNGYSMKIKFPNAK